MRGAFGPARGFESFLDVHAIIDNVGYKLRMGKGLIGAAHNAKADMGVASFHKCGNDGVERPLTAYEHIRMVRFERKAVTAILKNEPHSIDRHAGAKRFRHALNPAHHVARAIDYGEIRCVSIDRLARRDVAIRLMWINQSGALSSVFL